MQWTERRQASAVFQIRALATGDVSDHAMTK